jgi:hypothetical protein
MPRKWNSFSRQASPSLSQERDPESRSSHFLASGDLRTSCGFPVSTPASRQRSIPPCVPFRAWAFAGSNSRLYWNPDSKPIPAASAAGACGLKVSSPLAPSTSVCCSISSSSKTSVGRSPSFAPHSLVICGTDGQRYAWMVGVRCWHTASARPCRITGIPRARW